MLLKIQLGSPSTEVFYPINMDRLIKNIKNKYAEIQLILILILLIY